MTPDDPLARARALFDAQVEALDPARAGRLRTARRNALAGALPARPARWWPAGGLVTAALALALVLPGRPTDAPPPGTAPAGAVTPTNAGALASAADLAEGSTAELDEDPAFYAWLAEAPLDDASDRFPLPDEGFLP